MNLAFSGSSSDLDPDPDPATLVRAMAQTRGDRLLVWAIVASQFAPPFKFSVVAVALPAMGADLDAGATSLGLVETLFLAGGVAFLLPVGRLADAGDKRTLYKLGLLGFGISSALLVSLDIGNDPIGEHPRRFIGTVVTAFSVLSAITAVALVFCVATRTRR